MSQSASQQAAEWHRAEKGHRVIAHHAGAFVFRHQRLDNRIANGRAKLPSFVRSAVPLARIFETKGSRGDELYGMVGGVSGLQGAMAEIVVVNADLIALKPKSLSMLGASPIDYRTLSTEQISR